MKRSDKENLKKGKVGVLAVAIFLGYVASVNSTVGSANALDWQSELNGWMDRAEDRVNELKSDLQNDYSGLKVPDYDNMPNFDYDRNFDFGSKADQFKDGINERLRDLENYHDDTVGSLERIPSKIENWKRDQPALDMGNDIDDLVAGLDDAIEERKNDWSMPWKLDFQEDITTAVNNIERETSNAFDSFSSLVGELGNSVEITKQDDRTTIATLRTGNEDNAKIRQIREAWDAMPEPAKRKAIEWAETTVVVPVVYKEDNGQVHAGVGFATVSPLEGKFEVYEADKEDFVAIVTSSVIEEASGGLVSVDEVEKAEVQQIGYGKYEVAVDSTVNLLGVIPVPMQVEMTVDCNEGRIDGSVHLDKSEKPWWSAIAF